MWLIKHHTIQFNCSYSILPRKMFSINKATLTQYGLAIIVSLGSWAAGAWLTWSSIAVPKLRKGEVCCNASKSQVSTTVALMDFGNILSPIPASYLCNKYGRKGILYSTVVIFILASICVMVANDIWYLYIARVLAGLAKGIVFAVIPLYLAEVAEVNIRGRLGTIFAQAANLGMSFEYTLGAFFSYQIVNIANLLVPIIFGIGMFFTPESPYYLVMKGKIKVAQKNLAIYRQLPINNNILNAEMEIIEKTVEHEMKNKSRFIDVMSTKSRRRALLIVLLAAATQRLSGISPILAFSTMTLPEKGGGASREIYVMVMSYLMLASVYIGQNLVDSWGRKKLLLLSTFGCAAINCTFAVFFTLERIQIDESHVNWIPYACLLLFGFTWGIGLMSIPTILVGELFPTNIKSYASSLAAITYAVVSFAVNKLFGEISTKFGVNYMFYFFSISCLLCGICFSRIIFETKGKTFQEIQQNLGRISGEEAKR